MRDVWRHARRGILHVDVRGRRIVLQQRSESLCELPHHARAPELVAEVEPPFTGDVQRLPYTAFVFRKVFCEIRKRHSTFVEIHVPILCRTVAHHESQSGKSSSELHRMPSRRGSRNCLSHATWIIQRPDLHSLPQRGRSWRAQLI